MVTDVTTFNELDVIDFGWCLSPFEAIFIVELHTMWHHLETQFYQGVLCQLWIVAGAEEAQFLKLRLFFSFLKNFTFSI